MQFRLKMSPSHSYEVVILCFMIHFLKNFEKDHGGLTVLFLKKVQKSLSFYYKWIHDYLLCLLKFLFLAYSMENKMNVWSLKSK